MILQALTRLYEDLVQRDDIAPPGWGPASIRYALCLEENGTLLYAAPLLSQEQTGRKTILRPQRMDLPAAVSRTSGIQPNFLWDHSGYLLGVDAKGGLGRSGDCFRACARLHHRLLDGIPSPAAKGILAFFDTWQPEQAQSHPALVDCWEDLMKGANLVFRIRGIFAQEDPLIRAAWDRLYAKVQGETGQCLVTGRPDVIQRIHPSIKGVAGTKSTGAAIVSCNAPAFCSYGKEQSLNAPVGSYAAFAYTAALNHLLAHRNRVHRIADTTVVCWAEGAEPEYNVFSSLLLFGSPAAAAVSVHELQATVRRLAQGLPSEDRKLDPSRPFYLLGLAPNAARLSIRFFYRGTYGALMRSVLAHHRRMEIVGNPRSHLSLQAMLGETACPHTNGKPPSPSLAGSVTRAVLSGTAYPPSLLHAVMLRIRAERNITPGRAAILKAYYLQNPNPQCPQEVLTVSLNENSTNIPYTLGRLFAVYEAVQETASPGIQATIKDRYLNSASSAPAVTFPILDNLCQKHLRKLNAGMRIFFDRQIGQLKNVLGETYPLRLTLPEQGSFSLGYYHQKQLRYTKKEEKQHGCHSEPV